MNDQKTMKTAYFGGGCFWCTEAVFLMLRGVIAVEPGYAGGMTPNPTYNQVSSGKTGHAEIIKIDYDPSLISYEQLMTVFFAAHDPSTLNRQGADVGTQYRSIILYTTPEEKASAEKFIADINAEPGGKPAVTEVVPLAAYYPAENYHQNYYATHKDAMYCQLVINPKLDKVQKKFESLLKDHQK
jgi:peptide-methionine (S)-S-oxide reductase